MSGAMIGIGEQFMFLVIRMLFLIQISYTARNNYYFKADFPQILDFSKNQNERDRDRANIPNDPLYCHDDNDSSGLMPFTLAIFIKVALHTM